MLTYFIIGVTALVSFLVFNGQYSLEKLSLQPVQVLRRNQWYRMLSSGLVHADLGHLIFNMITLYFFGGPLERFFGQAFGPLGQILYLVLYIVGIAVANVPSLIRHRTDSYYQSIGASGAVSAVLFAFIVLSPLTRVCLFFALCLPGFIMGLLYLVYSIWASRQGNSIINHDAHLYGALFGLLFMAVVYPESLPYFLEQMKDFQLF